MSSVLTAGLPSRGMSVPYGAAGYRTPTDRDQWVDFGMLHRAIQRQLSPKLTFAAAETTYGTGDGLLVARCSLDGGNMRIADF